MTYVNPQLIEFDAANIAVLDAIAAANIAVMYRRPTAEPAAALAKARARLTAAITMVEASGIPVPSPFAGLGANRKPGDARARWEDKPQADHWQRPRAADRAKV